MSTFYLENDVDDVYDHICIHYFDDGWDVECLDEEGDVTILFADGEFNEELVSNVEDVFSGDNYSYIVISIPDNDGNVELLIYSMSNEEYENWKEQIWAKFRADMNDTVCPKCGKRMAHSVAGATYSDIGKINQFFCDECGYGWIGYPSGKFIREGTLRSQWDVI